MSVVCRAECLLVIDPLDWVCYIHVCRSTQYNTMYLIYRDLRVCSGDPFNVLGLFSGTRYPSILNSRAVVNILADFSRVSLGAPC